MAKSRRRFLQVAASSAIAPLSGSLTSAASASPAHGEQGSSTASGLRPRGAGEAVIVCTGDLFLMRQLSTPADAGTRAVYDVLREADAAFANLENGLSTVGGPELGGFRHGGALRGEPALARELSWAGVTAVSLANNHTGNYGPDALLETIKALDGAGIKHAGAGRGQPEAFAPAIVKAGGVTVALVSVYSFYYNFQATDVASETRPGIAACRAYDVLLGNVAALDATDRDKSPYLLHLLEQPPHVIVAPLKEDVDRLAAAVKQASTMADFTIVSAHIHWGRHTKHDLPAHQRVVAHAAIDAGADLFVGHGPHTIRGVERYRGKAVLHSLGNFVLMPPKPGGRVADASADLPPGQRGLIARVTIKRREIVALELLPIAIDVVAGPRFASGQLADRITGGLYGMSAALGTEVRPTGWFATIA